MGQTSCKHENDNTPVGTKTARYSFQLNERGTYNIFLILRGDIMPAQMSMHSEMQARVLVDGFNIALEEEEKMRLGIAE